MAGVSGQPLGVFGQCVDIDQVAFFDAQQLPDGFWQVVEKVIGGVVEGGVLGHERCLLAQRQRFKQRPAVVRLFLEPLIDRQISFFSAADVF